jgi:hypothetical protein
LPSRGRLKPGPLTGHRTKAELAARARRIAEQQGRADPEPPQPDWAAFDATGAAFVACQIEALAGGQTDELEAELENRRLDGVAEKRIADEWFAWRRRNGR